MNIHDEVMRNGWRDYTGGVNPAESPASYHAFRSGAEWARREALREAAAVLSTVAIEERPDDYHKPDLIWVFDAQQAVRALAEGEST